MKIASSRTIGSPLPSAATNWATTGRLSEGEARASSTRSPAAIIVGSSPARLPATIVRRQSTSAVMTGLGWWVSASVVP